MSVIKKFRPFDRPTIIKELQAIPVDHRLKLFEAMDGFAKRDRLGSYAPAVVKSYGGGIQMVKHSNNDFQGRVLFTERTIGKGNQEYTILTAYKKESQELPANVLKRARDRKRKLEQE